jgi:TetR/AcrR family tetracycline transcriptional repressor
MLLRKANVVDGALALLDTEGLDGLTMRKLGAALGVQAGALYRHFPSKQALLDAMAEKLVEGIAEPPPEGSWEQRFTTLAERFRAALLAHRDGARVVAGTFVSEPNNNAAGRVAVAALHDAGIPVQRAGWITFAGMYYVLGHTIEEQAQQQLTEPGDDWAARQTYGLRLFIDGIREQLPG